MIVVAITMQKGGVGKTTLTRSLSAAASADGFLAMAIDMDAQASTQMWARRRDDGQLPAVVFSTVPDLPHQLARARSAGCHIAFIDTPPAQSNVPLAAVGAADLALIPCTPDIEAYEQLPLTAQVVQALQKPCVGVLTMAAPQGMAEEKEAGLVFEMTKVELAPVTIYRRKAHRDACSAGKTAQELEPGSKAAEEISALWIWLRDRLGLHRGNVAVERSA